METVEFVKDKDFLSKMVPIMDFNDMPPSALDRLSEDIDKAAKALLSTPNAIAVSANQIGSKFRFFVCKYNILEHKHLKQGNLDKIKHIDAFVYINPRVFHLKGAKSSKVEEGCLSHDKIETVTRKKRIKFDCYFLKLTMEGALLLRDIQILTNYSAQIAQHEVDHLNGESIYDKKDEK